ncbi:MAG: hypothetical protein GF350_05220 [Chitinivibrionales bacterium]|nr:hypothetical protein [Chitinivibrionales bacterium]
MSRKERCDICGNVSNQYLIPINTTKSKIDTIQASKDGMIAPLKVCYKCYNILGEEDMGKNGVTYMLFSLSCVMKKKM